MKKFTKIISALLVVLMLASLVPAMALADDADEGDSGIDLGGIIDTVTGLEIPSYFVYCKLSNKMPASNAQITLTNQLTGESQTYTANTFGLALIPKSLLGVYNVSATCDGFISGMKYSTVAGITWTMSIKPDIDTLVLYPVLNIALNYSDHFSYLIGYEDNTVRPAATITRAEAASMIFRLLTADERDRIFTKENSFGDVNKDAWYNNAVSSLASAGIIEGWDGNFHPNDPITRQDFFTIVGRMFSVEYIGSPIFGDLNGNYADKYINLLASLGIIKGDENGNANPSDNITRAEAATLLNRLLGRQPASDSAESCTGYVKYWSDCSADAWYYADILEASNSHNYNWATDAGEVIGDDNLIHEVWTNIRTDTPNWAELQK